MHDPLNRNGSPNPRERLLQDRLCPGCAWDRENGEGRKCFHLEAVTYDRRGKSYRCPVAARATSPQARN